MPSFWSSISSSSKNPPLKGKSKSSNDIFKNSGSNNHNKKLTRQRKLRYATDDQVGVSSLNTLVGSQSLPVSPDAGSGDQTPRHVVGAHWSKTAVPMPMPLPLPEVIKPNESPIDPLLTRNPVHQTLGKTTDDIDGKSYKNPTNRRRRFPQELSLDTAQNDFRLHFPARSAPGSGYSSPVLSPQRYKTVDLFHPSFQVSSVLEKGSTSERLSKSYHLPPMPTPDHSTPHGNSRNSNGVFSHSHNKSFPESSAPNVHPLPRPPNVSRPSFSIDRPEFSYVRGQWQKGRPIGRGTYGSVYVATHRETGATCAVKEVEMVPDDPKSLECIKQLEQEMKFLRELKHPNIVQYYGCEFIKDRFCIYLEYVHPGSINKYVNEHRGAMTESIVRNFTRHIVSGLVYLHSTKTIHRDIKGPNLLVDAAGVVKLADFGLAKHLVGNDIDLSLKGTPHWMAPEVLQAAMRKDANPELAYGVDIWSVGCTVIEMLTGKPPWSECNSVQAMFSVLNKAPSFPETLSSEGKDFLQLCFQRRPVDRPSASKLLEHPFLRGSHDQNTGQEFSETKLPDAQSPGDRARRNKDVMPPSSVTRIQLGKLSLSRSGETSRKSSEIGANPHHSPRSTLEDLQGITSPELNRYSNGSSPSKVQNNLFSRAANNITHSFSCKGNSNQLIPKMVERKSQSYNVYQETK